MVDLCAIEQQRVPPGQICCSLVGSPIFYVFVFFLFPKRWGVSCAGTLVIGASLRAPRWWKVYGLGTLWKRVVAAAKRCGSLHSERFFKQEAWPNSKAALFDAARAPLFQQPQSGVEDNTSGARRLEKGRGGGSLGSREWFTCIFEAPSGLWQVRSMACVPCRKTWRRSVLGSDKLAVLLRGWCGSIRSVRCYHEWMQFRRTRP